MAFERQTLVQKIQLICRALAIETNRKPRTLMLRELAALAWRDRGMPKQYFTNFAYRADAGPASGYLSTRSRKRILDRLGKHDVTLDEKLQFYARARGEGLPIPRLLGTIHPDRIEIAGEVRHAKDPTAIAVALDEARNMAAHGSIFVKPNAGKSGQGCERIGPDIPKEILGQVAARLHGETFLVQETIVQHPDIARVSPSATGCVRAYTLTENGRPEILSMLMKFARGSTAIDNASQGAMFAPVDEASGRVLPPAMVHIHYGARKFDRHPETGAPFDIELPHWWKLLELVDHAACTFDNPFIGWDIAFAPNGPILIEGNNRADLRLAQSAARGLLNHPKLGPVCQKALHDP